MKIILRNKKITITYKLKLKYCKNKKFRSKKNKKKYNSSQ